jgi:diacylglycerol kinase family enzyme
MKGVKQKFHIKAEDFEIEKEITLACVCNGRFYGGGFNPVPEAEPGDGLLDCLIIDGVSRLKVPAIVGKYAKGRFRELKGIHKYFRGKRMEIEGDREFVVNIDGEIIRTEKICFSIVPKAVNFILPSGME